MVKDMIVLRSPIGIALSQAGQISEHAMKYESEIHIDLNEKQIRAKSLLGVLSLCAKQGDRLDIACEGDDEEQALEAMMQFIEELDESNM